MDIALIKTFLEVTATGSFVQASERLFVTQSAVSLRIARLEEQLGRQLFTRSKSGAEPTPAGRAFEQYALSLIKIWEEARQQVAVPAGFDRTLTIGAQYSLWPRLGFRWIDAVQERMPSLHVRAELGMPDRLTRFLVEGTVQAALIYTPVARPGLELSRVAQDELVLVASWPNPTLDMEGGRYVFVDWGPEFTHAHAIALPHLTNAGLTMSLGALAAEYVVRRRAAAYLPARAVKPMLDAGRLHLVPDAPRFLYPVWVVWRDDLEPMIRAGAETALARVIDDAERQQAEVLDELSELSATSGPMIMGPEGADFKS